MPVFIVTFHLQGVFDVSSEKGLHLIEIADGISVQDIVEATEAEFTVSGHTFVKLNGTFC